MKIDIPELALVVLIGASGSGKSTFARQHFKATEILSSDACRGMVSDDENDQSATRDAFDVLHYIARKRLAAGRLTVIDATNVQAEARKPLVALAREYHCFPIAVVLDVPERICAQRNETRPDRSFGPHVVRRQSRDLRRSLHGLRREGFHQVVVLDGPTAIEEASVQRTPLWTNRKQEHGPFDIIGDVHGCADELRALLEQLGYVFVHDTSEDTTVVQPPEGRRAIFLGDLVDRGPDTPGVLRIVMGMVEAGTALCVPGNHDIKLLRKLQGKDVRITYGLAESLAQLEGTSAAFRAEVMTFLDRLVSHYVLDDGKLVVAHAGMKAALQGRGSRVVRDFALYGETTGETDEFGLPIRYNWATEYRGNALVVYGHTPVPEPQWLNNTINIDTGCVFGGRLTALRYPEQVLVSVAAAQTYAEPTRPFLTEPVAQLSAQQEHDDILDIEDVQGKRSITTRLHRSVTVREENATAALEVMSRFAVNPAWLVYLPPTMSPSDTSKEPGLLEHPSEAFAYYRQAGIDKVICQEKHMGSRVVTIVCRDHDAARRRFGATDGRLGLCYTRTGRQFFDDQALEHELIERLRAACDASGIWQELLTDWLCLDAELMPWSAKAQGLLREQYAPVGLAAQTALNTATTKLAQAAGNGVDVGALLETFHERSGLAVKYVEAYQRYSWPVRDLDDLRLAPFHILAGEGHVYVDRNHLWHMEQIGKLCAGGARVRAPLFATSFQVVDVTDPNSVEQGTRWWEELTARGGEGMVVKPFDFIARGRHGLLQPAVKCRGREYLRIIYGPEYTLPEHLDRLRKRGLAAKRGLALREFALGIEGLERFVRNEPLRRVHECVFGVLALESEPVDPRL